MCCNLEHVLGLFPYLRRHQWGGLWPVFPTHSPSLGECAQERARNAPPPSSPAPGIRTCIKGEKHGRFLSLRCHNIDSRVSGMWPFLIQVEDESRTWGIVREMAHHTYGGWTSPRLLGASARRVEILSIWGGDTLHTEMNFAGWFIKTRMGLITNGGTFSKCGLPPAQYHIQSFFSSMYISLYKFSRSFDSAM